MPYGLCPTRVNLSKNLKTSSRSWIARQQKDPYVKKRLTDPAAYRSRSAFKLLEIDDQWDNFLVKSDVLSVVDLGAAPGGWSQVVATKLGWGIAPCLENESRSGEEEHIKKSSKEKDSRRRDRRTGSAPSIPFDPLNIDEREHEQDKGFSTGRGTIIAVDLLRMQPIHGVLDIQADFLAPQTENTIHSMLGVKGNMEGKADVILSDMAANSTGNETRDTQASLEICEAVFDFATRNLRSAESIGRKRGGVLLVKHFEHPLLQKFRYEKLVPNFHDTRYIKPESSRSSSKEGYFLCRGWKGDEQYNT